jgi:hypothetical protein
MSTNFRKVIDNMEAHTVVCDTSESEILPAYLIAAAVPEMQKLRARLADNLDAPVSVGSLNRVRNDLLRMEVALTVLDSQLATAKQEGPYDCGYNDEVEGYRDGDTFTWICPQCGREQDTILPTAAELREESQ